MTEREGLPSTLFGYPILWSGNLGVQPTEPIVLGTLDEFVAVRITCKRCGWYADTTKAAMEREGVPSCPNCDYLLVLAPGPKKV